MLTGEQKKQFTIFVFDKNINTGPATKVALTQSGFDAHYFNESGVIKAHVESNTPHVVLIDLSSIDEPLSEFMGFFNRISPEILFIFVSDFKEFDQLKLYEKYGLWAVLSREPQFFEDRAVLVIEKMCESLFLSYQNEQLFERFQLLDKENVSLKNQLNLIESRSTKNLEIPKRLNDYSSAESIETLLQKFLNQFPHRKIIFFKYLEPVRSLLALNAQGLEISKLSGLGLQIEVKDLQLFYEQILLGLAPPQIISSVSNLFETAKLKSYPIYVFEKLQGFFITVDQDRDTFESEMSLFSLCFSHLNLEKRLDTLEVRDLLTGLKNKKGFLAKINEEIQRSARSKGFFSVIKVGLDRIEEIQKNYGELIGEESLKLVGNYLQKLCRTSDEIFRTDLNEFAVFLPETHKEEASVLCERIRRYFVSHSMEDKGFQSSLSFGISEYPQLAQTVEAIDESSTKALRYIQDQGGNKICFYKKPG